jgi:hypothetical protein
MLFSQRKGLKPLSKEIQKEDIDQELRNGLWSCFHLCYLGSGHSTHNFIEGTILKSLFMLFWTDYFKWPIDKLNLYDFSGSTTILRNYFYGCNWNEVYDFIEFTIKNGPDFLADKFRAMVNVILEREFSAYRFVGDVITEITSKEEIETIQSAIADTSAIKGVQVHLEQALSHLANRKKPDYRNSIKESISAVEGLCRVIAEDPNATLGQALKKLEPDIPVHPALREAFSKLYGYTNDEKGIRHAMLDETRLSFSDAKFMLVACSAFINYILGKYAEKGLSLE